MNSAATVIGEGDKLINVVLLNGERLNVRVQASSTGQDLYNVITEHLGLTETIFFGLMIIKDGEHEFLDFNEKLSKLAKFAPHLWKDDVSCNSSLVFTIFFRVKYYVENICLLQQQCTRHLYYLQLRKDVLEGGIYVHEETAMLLASYALQAEVGDYNQTLHGSDYFVPEHYLPQRAIAKLTASSIKKQLPSMHKTHTGLSDAQAEIEYLKEAQKLQEYGIIFNKVSKYKKDKRGGFSLGISVRGLIVYEERGIVKSPTFRHPWQNIKRMAFHRRRFYIEAHGDPETSKMVLYTCSYKKSRYLLKMCTSFYKFQMMMGMKLTSLKEYPRDGAVRMNGVVKTDETDSVASMPVSTAEKPGHESAVIQPQGIGPAIHLNGSSVPVPEDQPVQVSVHPVQLQKVEGSLGLNIIGGIELGGIYVKTMAPEGPAALSGKINIGDRILEINGHSLEGLSRQEAVNILRTAPYVCTLLIESCVAAPATPNGKPAMPGTQAASAFYQPNRQQQMQTMMQRQPSVESQYSSMQQQFVPSQSQQIEDIVTVSNSTTSLDQTKRLNEEGTVVQPFRGNTAFVSAQIRARAMNKKLAMGNKASLEAAAVTDSRENLCDNLAREGETRKVEEANVIIVEQSSPTWLANQRENSVEEPLIDENSQLLSTPEQKGVAVNDDSNVAGFFRKIQSFLFSPSPPKVKNSEESESSCCESDFDSEFSEMTSESFNVGEIEAIRDELETLLLSGPQAPELFIRDKSFIEKSPRSAEVMTPQEPFQDSPPLVQEALTLSMPEAKEVTHKNNGVEENEESSIELIETGDNTPFLAEGGTEIHVDEGKDQVVSTSEDNKDGIRDADEKRSLIYRATSFFKTKKETTV